MRLKYTLKVLQKHYKQPASLSHSGGGGGTKLLRCTGFCGFTSSTTVYSPQKCKAKLCIIRPNIATPQALRFAAESMKLARFREQQKEWYNHAKGWLYGEASVTDINNCLTDDLRLVSPQTHGLFISLCWVYEQLDYHGQMGQQLLLGPISTCNE